MTAAVAELQTLSPLKERAMLAYLDQKSNEDGYLVKVAEEVCRTILVADIDQVTEVNNGAEFVLFMVDDLKFKMAIGTRKTPSTYEGEAVHEEETRKLYVFIGTNWKEIESLADLGQWIKLS